MTTTHLLEVDGYYATSEERAFEGVMFQVTIEESPGSLTIVSVDNRPQDADYLKKYRMETFTKEVREYVQSNIDHLIQLATSQGKTINDLLDEWEVEAPREPRIEVLNEV